jgi:hypothetical protein
MITSNLVGGLGNYMFQIATAFSLAVENKDELLYNINDSVTIHKHLNSYLNNIFNKINFTNKNLLITEIYEEPHFHYKKIEYKPNLKLNGYYQSEKYFINNRDKVIDLFKINPETELYIKNKYGDFLKEDICSLHVRRGDYLKFPDYHPVCDVDYYLNSVKEIGEDTLYFIFSDDVEWCLKNLSFIKNKIFIEGNEDYQDLFLMTKCKNNIIANSSFSWWGAWLNNNPNKIVIAPKKWFGLRNSHLNTSDLYCENWVVL